jgi:hypothetical protein
MSPCVSTPQSILHLLVQNPLCKKVVVVTRRNVAELANSRTAIVFRRSAIGLFSAVLKLP